MEWQGIDLTHNRESKWIFTTYNHLKNIFFILIFIIGISGLLTFYTLQKNQKIEPLVMELNRLKNENLTLENKINQLKNNHHISLPFAKKTEIEKLFNLINQLPLKNGGINTIQIYLEKELYLKMNGKLTLQSDFQKLEKHLNQQTEFEIKTDQINVNHKNETEFIFTLKYKG